jgi:hypothetical protein
MSNLTDIVSGANLYNGKNYSFKADRFGNPKSAIYFQNGYLQAPSGVYFRGDFTFTAWINIQSYQAYSRIIDFGNGGPSDNVFLFFNDTTPYIGEAICSGTICNGFKTVSSIKFQLNKWYHVAFVLNGTIGSIYVNGILATNCTNFAPNNVQRANNYIGKSNWADPNANAIYDEIKIYQGAMSQANVVNDYSYSSSKLIF